MGDESYNFTQARARLEEIVSQVRRKDVSLEKSLDLLEEGVRLANACTELIDHTEWRSVVTDEEMAAAVETAEARAEKAADGEGGSVAVVVGEESSGAGEAADDAAETEMPTPHTGDEAADADRTEFSAGDASD